MHTCTKTPECGLPGMPPLLTCVQTNASTSGCGDGFATLLLIWHDNTQMHCQNHIRIQKICKSFPAVQKKETKKSFYSVVCRVALSALRIFPVCFGGTRKRMCAYGLVCLSITYIRRDDRWCLF